MEKKFQKIKLIKKFLLGLPQRTVVRSLYGVMGLVVIVGGAAIYFTLKHLPASIQAQRFNLSQEYTDCIDKPRALHDKGLCLKDLGIYVSAHVPVSEIDSALNTVIDQSHLQWCHEFMHYVGWGIFDKTHNLYDAFMQASGTCDSGMYHGIVEEYINKANLQYDPNQFIKAVTNACASSTSSQNLPPATQAICYHGLGHGFMFITDNELNKSLQLCDHLEGGYAKSCYSGAFMENVQSKQVGREASHPSKYSFDTKNPDYPCNTLTAKYIDFCYLYKGISNVVLTSGDFKKSFELCLTVNPAYQERCMYGVGSDIPGPFMTTTAAAERCSVALDVDPRAYSQCIKGAMSFLVQINLGKPQAAVDFCNVTRAEYKNICYAAAGYNLRDWLSPGQTIEQACSHFSTSQAQESCQSFKEN